MPLTKKPEFWTVVADVIVSAATFFGGRYLAPDEMEVVYWCIGSFQAVTGMLMAHFLDVRAEQRAARVAGAVSRALER